MYIIAYIEEVEIEFDVQYDGREAFGSLRWYAKKVVGMNLSMWHQLNEDQRKMWKRNIHKNCKAFKLDEPDGKSGVDKVIELIEAKEADQMANDEMDEAIEACALAALIKKFKLEEGEIDEISDEIDQEIDRQDAENDAIESELAVIVD